MVKKAIWKFTNTQMLHQKVYMRALSLKFRLRFLKHLYIYLILVCKYRSIQTCISTSLLQSSVICTKSESKRSQMHETITKHILLKCTVQLGVSFGFIKDKNEPSRNWCTFLFIPASLYSAPLSCWCQTVSRVYRLLCYIFVHILGESSL